MQWPGQPTITTKWVQWYNHRHESNNIQEAGKKIYILLKKQWKQLCAFVVHSFDENSFWSCPLFGRTNGYKFCFAFVLARKMDTFHIPSQHPKQFGCHLNVTI